MKVLVYLLCVAWGLSIIGYMIGSQRHAEWRRMERRR